MTTNANCKRTQKTQQIYISCTTPEFELKAEAQLIVTDTIAETVREIKENATTKISITIVSDADNAYSDTFIASSLKTKLQVCNEIYNLASISRVNKSLMMSKYARCAPELETSLEYTIAALVDRIPREMTLKTAKEIIIMTVPAFRVGNQSASEYACMLLDQKVTARNKRIIDSISIDPENPNVEYIDIEYGPELVQYILDNPGNYALVGMMSSGKTQFVNKPLFKAMCEAEMFPVLCGAKQILMASIVSGERHYKTAQHLLRERISLRRLPVDGAAGVVNTLFGTDRFSDLIEVSQATLFEEYEAIRSHMVSKAVGLNGTLMERAELNDAADAKMASSKTNVFADAMLSNDSVNHIAAVTSKKVIVCRQKQKPNNITVKYYASEDQNVAVTKEALAAGKNVATFCDGSHNANRSRFNELHKAIATNGINSLIIDGASMSKEDDSLEFIKNIDEELKQYQHVMISPVVNSGLSVQNKHFSLTTVLGYRTNLPTQLVQSMCRFRDVTDVGLSINDSRRDNEKCCDRMLLSNELYKELQDIQMTDEMFDKHLNDPSVSKVIDRIAFENEMRRDYTNTVLVMLEHLGFNVEIVAADKDLKKKGNDATKCGTETEEAVRSAAIQDAEKISTDDAQKIRANQEFSTQDSKYKLAAHDIRHTYEVKEIDDALIDFDSHGAGRTVIRNMQYAREDISKNTSAVECIKRKTIHAFFEMLSINTKDFSGVYSEHQSKAFMQWVNTGIIRVGERDVTAREAINITFPDATVKKQAGAAINSILSSGFRLEAMSAGSKRINKKPTRHYVIVETERSYKAEQYYAHIDSVRNQKEKAGDKAA
ncbi:MAG: hypothetical protein GYB18_19905 [Oceanospirillales bacterium]|nr:hypothetical protein [Oceanospirillales bacterium]